MNIEQERAAFEAVVRANDENWDDDDFLIDNNGKYAGQYASGHIELLWQGWQMKAAQAHSK